MSRHGLPVVLLMMSGDYCVSLASVVVGILALVGCEEGHMIAAWWPYYDGCRIQQPRGRGCHMKLPV